ncbi:MAG: hypothetical protein ACREXW_18110 [Gammaproteobacteria bacterium]
MTIHFRVNREAAQPGRVCRAESCARRCSGTKAAARTTRDYPDTLPVSFSTVLVSRNKALQSLGLWRDMPR